MFFHSVCEEMTRFMSSFPHYTTIVLTGEFGTRLSSVVPDQPKILAPIGNTPFLTYFLEWFSNSSGDLSISYTSD